MKTPLFALCALLLAGTANALAQDEQGNRVDGLVFARETCASCHDVEAPGISPAQGPAASFHDIANTPGMTAMALTVWLRSPHRDMPHLHLSDKQLRDVVAYIESLRSKPDRR